MVILPCLFLSLAEGFIPSEGRCVRTFTIVCFVSVFLYSCSVIF